MSNPAALSVVRDSPTPADMDDLICCPNCGDNLSVYIDEGFASPVFAGAGKSLRISGKGTSCLGCGWGLEVRQTITFSPGRRPP